MKARSHLFKSQPSWENIHNCTKSSIILKKKKGSKLLKQPLWPMSPYFKMNICYVIVRTSQTSATTVHQPWVPWVHWRAVLHGSRRPPHSWPSSHVLEARSSWGQYSSVCLGNLHPRTGTRRSPSPRWIPARNLHPAGSAWRSSLPSAQEKKCQNIFNEQILKNKMQVDYHLYYICIILQAKKFVFYVVSMEAEVYCPS